MDFLDLIWLIPLFPLAGAALMLLIGKKLDPQPPSEVAVAPGVEPIWEHGHGHGHEHGAHSRSCAWHDHGTITRMTIARMIIGHGHHHHSPLKIADQVHLPGDGAALVPAFGRARCGSFRSCPSGRKQIIQFTWIAGLPFHMANGQLATFTSTGASCSTRSAR